jgi:hypothetical protein
VTDFSRCVATRAVALVLMVALTGSSVGAQGAAALFKVGQRVRVKLADGTQVSGKLTHMSPDDIVLIDVQKQSHWTTWSEGPLMRRRGGRLVLSRQDITSITRAGHPQLWAAVITAATLSIALLVAEIKLNSPG